MVQVQAGNRATTGNVLSDIVKIGDATLYHGDCLEILPTLDKVDAVVTDPPYGVNLGDHAGSKDNRLKHLTKQGYESYQDTPENFKDVVVPAIEMSLDLSDRGAVFSVPPSMWLLPAPTAIGGVYLPNSVGRHSWGFSSLSHCLLYGKGRDVNLGCKKTAIRNQAPSEKNGHPTPKPLQWMEFIVDLASRQNDTVIDPFMGSGTTGVACANLGRKFIGIEIERKYFDIACERIDAAYAQGRLFA